MPHSMCQQHSVVQEGWLPQAQHHLEAQNQLWPSSVKELFSPPGTDLGLFGFFFSITWDIPKVHELTV